MTHAKPTPTITGKSETTFIGVTRVRSTIMEMMMVNSGVEARTTWWNYPVSSTSPERK
jgi:hypothetical protein